jgi:hypothetical protein
MSYVSRGIERAGHEDGERRLKATFPQLNVPWSNQSLPFSKKMLKTSLIVSILEWNGPDGPLWRIKSSRIAITLIDLIVLNLDDLVLLAQHLPMPRVLANASDAGSV